MLAGAAFGVASVAFGRDHPGWWFAGESPGAAAVELAAGIALVLAGAAALRQPGRGGFGLLLAGAGFAWFVPEWTAPEVTGALPFTAALALVAVWPALLGQAALAYPRALPVSQARRGLVAFGYLALVGLVGLLPSMLLLSGDTSAAETVARVGFVAAVAWAGLVIVALLVGLLRSSVARRRLLAPVVFPASLALGAAGVAFGHSVERAYLGNDSFDLALWWAQAAGLIVLAAGSRWESVRARRTRAALARLVVEVEREPATGGLRAALARDLDDPSLELLYRRPGGDVVHPLGRELTADDARILTPLRSGGRELAVVAHRAGAFDDPRLAEEIAAAARLALDNERLRAELYAQLEDLRASRARIVAAGDAERRRLERDLHDGAQQRLVSLMLSVGLARAQLGSADPVLDGRLEEAQRELRELLAALRELAHGLYPAVLGEEGLAAAVEALVEDRAGVRLEELTEERAERAVETAAYLVIRAGLGGSADDRAARVAAVRENGVLRVSVTGRAVRPPGLVALEDRVGAVGGRLVFGYGPGGEQLLTAELPCA
jgi:Histidine kinase